MSEVIICVLIFWLGGFIGYTLGYSDGKSFSYKITKTNRDTDSK